MPLDTFDRPCHWNIRTETCYSRIRLGIWIYGITKARGSLSSMPGGGMRLGCLGSRQGGPGCMAFFRPDLPDGISISYDLVVRSQGGLVINYLAIRGLNGEDLIADSDRLEPRTGVMKNYYATRWGLQSYHVSCQPL